MKDLIKIWAVIACTTMLFGLIGYYGLYNGGRNEMNEIAVAVISLVGSVIGVGIVKLVGWKKVLNRMGDCKNRPISERFNNIEKLLENDIGVDKNSPCLTEQHHNIEKIMREEIKDTLCKTAANTDKTFNIIEFENKQRKQRELLLSANEFRLSQAIDELAGFKDVFYEKSEEIQRLSSQILLLQAENQNLQNTVDKLRSELNEIRAEQNDGQNENDYDMEM